MAIYQRWIKNLLWNYIFGSAVAVLGVGSVMIFNTLEVSGKEIWLLSFLLFSSLVVMILLELLVFFRDLKPIRQLFQEERPQPETLRRAYFQTHRFPILAVKRTLGPHLLGMSVPAMIQMVVYIYCGWVDLPYYYIGIAGVGALLVASMHALIEFFLTNRAIRPVLIHIRQVALELHGEDLSLDGRVLVSIQRKFQLSAFLIGTFPLFLFSLATQIRLGGLEGGADYWKWAGMILVLGIAFASLGAWLLSRDIQDPIRKLYQSMGAVQSGDFNARAADIYSDEFSRLVTGFNHMVSGLKSRERMNDQLLQSYFRTLAAALDARDPYTAGHSERVAAYSVRIGELAQLDAAEMDILHKSALLHDIGKIGVRDAVLLKEGRLTDEEFAMIKLHPVLGEMILQQIEPAEAMAQLLPGVRSHHERYDGLGYPDGLAGTDIPLLGRIIAIADAYDAMTSDRPYRQGMAVERSLNILDEGRGTQWDPALTELFVTFMRRQPQSEDGEAAKWAVS